MRVVRRVRVVCVVSCASCRVRVVCEQVTWRKSGRGWAKLGAYQAGGGLHPEAGADGDHHVGLAAVVLRVDQHRPRQLLAKVDDVVP